MVFNAIHGVDPKDPGTVMTPFHFDRNIKLASMRIGVDAAEDGQVLADHGAERRRWNWHRPPIFRPVSFRQAM